MNISVPPPFNQLLPPNPVISACECPVCPPSIVWQYPQKMAILSVGSTMFGVFASVGLIFLLNKYNQIFSRMRRITGFKLSTIPENPV